MFTGIIIDVGTIKSVKKGKKKSRWRFILRRLRR